MSNTLHLNIQNRSDYEYDSSPNPAKLIESMRHVGYNNYTALADLIDNSFDADATEVNVHIRTKNSEVELILIDNGIGMSEATLGEAIKLGSNTIKNQESDLGKFGMGLCTASLSICRQTTVLTKTEGGKVLKAVNDINKVIKENKFISYLGESNEDDLKLFDEHLPNAVSGTIIVLKNCDRIGNTNTSVFASTTIKEFGRIFRYFIDAGRTICVNGNKVKSYDPLLWDDPSTEQYSSEFIEVSLLNSEGKKVIEKIAIKLAILAQDEVKGEKDRAQNIRHQGFQVMRNNREIVDASALEFFTKHNSMNRFRGEISFSGNMDGLFGINFTKKNIVIQQSLRDQLDNYLKGNLKTIRDRLDKRAKKDTPENIKEIHLDAAKEINKKAKLLLRPKAQIEKREPQANPSDRKALSNDTKSIREPGVNKQEGHVANCEFRVASMGAAGVVFHPEQIGRTVIITYNSDHPFYQKFILGYGETDRGLVAGIDYLIYSLACAELMQNNEEEDVASLVENFKSIMSSNLRTLLS
jgi:Histidine kinase-, DNA gyrase B-, and HSP90-like ATPase